MIEDKLFNFIRDYEEREQERYGEDEIERVGGDLKLERLKLIKEIAKRIQKPQQSPQKAIVATPKETLTDTPRVTPKAPIKLPVKPSNASTEELIETFISTFISVLSEFKPRKVLSTKQKPKGEVKFSLIPTRTSRAIWKRKKVPMYKSKQLTVRLKKDEEKKESCKTLQGETK